MTEFNKYVTTADPCPRCGAAVESWETRPEYVRSNPSSIMSIPDPDCPHSDDPDADCTCFVVANPAPDPALDRMVKVGEWVTFGPCGDTFTGAQLRDWKVIRTVKPGWHQAQLDRLVADAMEHGVSLKYPKPDHG